VTPASFMSYRAARPLKAPSIQRPDVRGVDIPRARRQCHAQGYDACSMVTVHDLDGNQSGNRKTGRQEGRIGLAGKSPEAVLEDGDVEVYEE
jgi:hypothetical protein